ncbi:hypothetical protein ACWKWU_18450 [Chitinophaga lutea]
MYRIFLLTGIVLLFVAGFLLKRTLDFIDGSQRAVGAVVSYDEVDGAYEPVFSVNTPDHGNVTYHHPAASKPAAWDIGEEAVFLYEPSDPSSLRMFGYFWLFNWSLVLTGIAVPLIVIGAGYYILRPKISVV